MAPSQATATLHQLSVPLGAPTTVAYSAGSILATFAAAEATTLDRALESAGASIDHALDIPTGDATVSIRVGTLAGVRFHLETGRERDCSVRLFQVTAAARPGNPWALEHDILDAVLARTDDRHGALLSYLERQLLSETDGGMSMAADLASLVASVLRRPR
jgi:hypothetical protein